MTVTIASITVDCEDALLVATFWSAALGRPLDPGANSDFARIGFAYVRPVVGRRCLGCSGGSRGRDDRVGTGSSRVTPFGEPARESTVHTPDRFRGR